MQQTDSVILDSLQRLRSLIAASRARLAELEAAYTSVIHSVCPFETYPLRHTL